MVNCLDSRPAIRRPDENVKARSGRSRSRSASTQPHSSTKPDVSLADLKRDLFDSLAVVWKRNNWATRVRRMDDEGKRSDLINYFVEMVTGLPRSETCHLLPDSNTLASRVIQFLIMDGVYEPLPVQCSQEEYEGYIKKLSRMRINCNNIYLARALFHDSLECNKGEIFLLPTKELMLRLIKIVEDKAVSIERGQVEFLKDLNSTKWVTDEDWIDPKKGAWEGAPQRDQHFYHETKVNRQTGADDVVPIYQYQLSFFVEYPVPSFNWKEVQKSDGSTVVDRLEPVNHLVSDKMLPPFTHDPPIKPFFMPLEPVYVILMYVFSFRKREAEYINEEKDGQEWTEFQEIWELCYYFFRLVTMDYPSQFRSLKFPRPSSIPFRGPAEDEIPDHLWNTDSRNIYLATTTTFEEQLAIMKQKKPRKAKANQQDHWLKTDWSEPVFSTSTNVLDLMDCPLNLKGETSDEDDPMPALPEKSMIWVSEEEAIEMGLEVFEALRLLGLQYPKAVEDYIVRKKVSMNEAMYWLLTTSELDELDDRIDYYEKRHHEMQEIMVDRDFSIEAVHKINPGVNEELAGILRRPISSL